MKRYREPFPERDFCQSKVCSTTDLQRENAVKMAKREPGYCLHKPTGQAYVNLGGKVHYLGEYNSDLSIERYNRLKTEWITNRHLPKTKSGPAKTTVADVCNAFLDHSESYYGKSEQVNFELACRPLSELYSTVEAEAFGVVAFRACRQWWLQDPKRSRQYVNRQMKRLVHVFKWAAGEGLIPAAIHQTLACVATLQKGRTTARDTEPVKPVDDTVVDATIKHLPPVVVAMVRFQRLTGARPGEVCMITPSMVDRSNAVWEIQFSRHKTAHKGKSRTLFVGPQAQAILLPFLLRGADRACFSPIEAEKQRNATRHAERLTPPSHGKKWTNSVSPLVGDSYCNQSYRKAIRHACMKAYPVPKHLKEDTKTAKKWRTEHTWSPNQLRHTMATQVRKSDGLEAASVLLGHSGLAITQCYAEQDRQQAIDVALRIG